MTRSTASELGDRGGIGPQGAPPRSRDRRDLTLVSLPDFQYSRERTVARGAGRSGAFATRRGRGPGERSDLARGSAAPAIAAWGPPSPSREGPAPAPGWPRPSRRRDESDPRRRAAELAQRGRLILDVSAADLEAAEAACGPFHPTTWHFRNAWNEARRSWERLRAEWGTKTLEAALNQPPLVVLTLGEGDPARRAPPVVLVPIAGQTYCAHRVAGTELAPVQ